MSRWAMARGPLVCARQSCAIVAGEFFRKMTLKDWPYCASCATEITGEQPPTSAEGTVFEAKNMTGFGFAERMAKFSRPAVASEVRGNILDWRAKQAGRDD